jgi:beta-N-acetylhexosaminidase
VPREIARRLRRIPPLVAAVVVLVSVGVAVGLSKDGDGEGGAPGQRPAASRPAPKAPPPGRSFLARIVPSPAGGLPGARVPGVIRRLVKRLPVERKAAQLMLVGFQGQDPSATFFRTLKRNDYGGVVFERRNYRDDIQLEAMTASVANATARRGHEPPLVLARQEGGDQSAFPDFPPAALPGDLAGLKDAVAEFGRTAQAFRSLGMNGIIGPAVDVGSHSDQLGARAFSDDPALVAEYAKAGTAAFRRAKLLSAPEHFPGIGGATAHTDEGPAQVGLSLDELRERDLVPFRAAIRAGAPAIVVGHASYAPDDFVLPASLSKTFATDVLRGGLGFRGVAISDDLAAGAIASTQPSVFKAAVDAIVAGVDMVWISGPPSVLSGIYRAILAAIKKGTISRGRLDTAVTRIITVKRELGLRIRKRTPPPQYPNAANPGSGQVEPVAPGVGGPQPPAPAAPQPAPAAPQPAAP